MFGAFRLALALAVVFSHMGPNLGGLHPGIAAVVCFYMVSGYAMSALIGSAYPRLGDIGGFYRDRLLRLAPQYYFYIAVCTFTIFVLGWRLFQPGPADLVNVIANLTILPLTFFMYVESIGNLMLDLPTWTIGLELSFYLILPFLLLNRWLLWVATACGAIVWAASTHGIINADYYAYRLLPGVLVFFAVGIAIQRQDRMLYWALVLFFILDGVSLAIVGKLNFVWNASLLIGAGIGCVMVPLLANFDRNKFDDHLGTASYGCYLAHWIFVTALWAYQGQAWAMAVAMAGSALSGWLSYLLVEAPTVRLRRDLRRRWKAIAVSAPVTA